MKILRVKKTNIYDIFIGIGWKKHSRVVVKKNVAHHISGFFLSKAQEAILLNWILERK